MKTFNPFIENAKICPKCDGNWLRMMKKPGNWILGGWYLWKCDKCQAGKILPKEIIMKSNSSKLKIIY